MINDLIVLVIDLCVGVGGGGLELEQNLNYLVPGDNDFIDY